MQYIVLNYPNMQHAVGHLVKVLKRTCTVSPMDNNPDRYKLTFEADPVALDSLKRAIPALVNIKVHQHLP
jgi:hypothetical protein